MGGRGPSARPQGDDEDGCIEVQDGRWDREGAGGVRPGVQPDAAIDAGGVTEAGGRAVAGELRGRVALAGDDGGEGMVRAPRAGDQSVSPRSGGAAGAEASAEGLPLDDEATGRAEESIDRA